MIKHFSRIMLFNIIFSHSLFAMEGEYQDNNSVFKKAEVLYGEERYEEAFSLFLSLGKQNHTGAQYYLKNMYIRGLGIKIDPTEALYWLKLAASQHMPAAQYDLGCIYFLDKNYFVAWTWFLLAAKQKHSGAQEILGVMYLEGKGVEPDYQEAFRWTMLAANQNKPGAQNNLGRLYSIKRNYGEALNCFLVAAKQGLCVAQYNLANFYYEGRSIIKPDYQEAFKWFSLAAEQHHALSQYKLGIMYFRGEYVKKDHKEALEWFNKAFNQGILEAKYAMQECMKMLRY